MAGPERKILIAGCGPGAADHVTPAVRQAVKRAEVLVGAARLLELFPGSRAVRVPVTRDVGAALEAIGQWRVRKRVVVLVSGDPGLCSLARPIIRRFGAGVCEVLPGVSSVQVAFARVGLDWLGARLVDAHGRTPSVDEAELAATEKIAVLAGTPKALRWTARLAQRLRPARRVVVCEDLTLPGERVRDVPAAELARLPASSRTIILLLPAGRGSRTT